MSPLQTKTTFIRPFDGFWISDSRCCVVGLNPMVIEETRGGGSMNNGVEEI